MLISTRLFPRNALCLIVIPYCFCGSLLTIANPTSSRGTNARGTAVSSHPIELQLLLKDLAQQEQTVGESISKLPGFSKLRGLSRRGDLRMFLGDHRGALDDYSEMIAIDAAQDTPHWRRGIAYYFNGRFQEGAEQFERYHAYDARDRENGLWKFLCDLQSKGVEHARSKMLPYKQFDRHPFPQLYSLYGGTLSLADYNEAVRPHVESSRMVKFFHLYYRGLHVVTSDKKAGIADIREAVSLFSASEVAETGPGYMWHCARLHLEFIERQ
jgi:lipoprotein NlpI